MWKQQTVSYQVTTASENAAPGKLSSVDSGEGAYDSLYNSYASLEFVFTADSAYRYANVQQAKKFIADWDLEDSADESVNVTATSQNVVQLAGKKTTQTVTLTYAADDNAETFTTNTAGDSAYTYYQVPASCPDNTQPDWYYLFLNQNAKSQFSSTAVAKPSPALPPNRAQAPPARPVLIRGSGLRNIFRKYFQEPVTLRVPPASKES